LIETFHISWKANVKARLLNVDLENKYKKINGEKPFRAQLEMYNYYSSKLDVIYEKI
jgi:polyphosphate kinase